MNVYLEPPGFLGTGASLLADLTLLAYLLLIIPAMVGGYYLARRGLHRPHHQWLMIIVTAVNWVLILVLMVVAYNFDVIGNIAQQSANPRYLLPTLHGLLGLPAQLLATYTVYRMAREDTQVARAKARGERNLKQYWFLNAKPVMRITLALWLLTAALGVVSYLIRYNVVSFAQGDAVAPAATPELSPVATAEVTADAPVSTPDVTPELLMETPEITAVAPAATLEILLPASTPEVAPVTTPEISDDRDDDDDDGSPRVTPEAPVTTPEISDDRDDDDDDN
jgi:uncharacterized membrane protein YozB (DUF420 family)